MENYFTKLNAINVNDKVEKKNGLTYLSWAWAWGEVKKQYPEAVYTIYENKDGWNYHTDGRTCWVKTGVTVNGIEHIEYLPVMDYKNRSIAAEQVTSFDVNKAIQRSLTKAVARHGLGLYIYAGEDLPEDDATAGLVAAPVATIDHPKKSTKAAVGAEDLKAKALHQLKLNAMLAYGGDADKRLAELMASCNVTADTMTNDAYKQINSQIAEAIEKKGAA